MVFPVDTEERAREMQRGYQAALEVEALLKSSQPNAKEQVKIQRLKIPLVLSNIRSFLRSQLELVLKKLAIE